MKEGKWGVGGAGGVIAVVVVDDMLEPFHVQLFTHTESCTLLIISDMMNDS